MAGKPVERRALIRHSDAMRISALLRKERAKRQQAEKKLVDERHLLQTLINQLPEVVWVKDRDSRFLLANSTTAYVLRGLPPESVIGKSDFDIHTPELAQSYFALEQEVMKTGEARLDFEETILAADGELRWLLTSKIPLRDSAGSIIGLIGMSRDVTEHKQAEDHFRKIRETLQQDIEQRTEELRLVSEQLSERSIQNQQTEDRLRLLASAIQSVGESIIITDSQLERPGPTIVFVNEAASRLTGYRPDELIGKTPRVLQGPQTSRKNLDILKQTLREGGQFDGEVINYRKDGSEFYVEWHVNPVWNEQGQITHYVSVQRDITERKKAEERLARSEARYRAISELISDYAFAFYFHAEQQPASHWMTEDAFKRVTGYEFHELSGPRYMLYHPDDQAQVDRDLQRIQRGETFEAQYRIVTKSGNARWVQIYRRPIWNESHEQVIGFYGVAKDIHDRKLAEQRLAESEQRYKAVSELISDYAYSYGVAPDGAIIEEWTTEEAFLRVTGYEYQEIAWANLSLYHPDDAPLVRRDVEKVIAGQESSGEYRIITKIGETRWLEIFRRPVWDEKEKRVIRFYGVARDITERKRAEEQLSFQANILSRVNDAVTVANHVGILEYWNEGAEKLFGYSAEEVLGRRVSDFLKYQPLEPEKEGEAASRYRNAQEVVHQEFMTVTKQGDHIYVEAAVQVVRETTGAIESYISLARNITERKRMAAAEREQRILAEALRDTAAVINSSLDLTQVLDHIMNEVGRVLPHDGANVMLIEADMIYVAHHSLHYAERGVSDFTKSLRFSTQSTPIYGEMLREQKPIWITDTTADSRWLQVPESWVRSYVSAPIRFGGEVIGFLNLDGATPGMFNEDHARRLNAFADLAGTAIQNARLFDAISKYALEMEERVTERTDELEAERKNLQAILDATGEGIFYTEGMNIQYANLALLNLLRYENTGQIIGLPTTILRPVNGSEENLEKLRSISQVWNGGVWRGEVQLTRMDGEVFDAGLTVALLSEPDETPVRAVTVVRDISQEKLLREQKTRFIEHASHELRTPITNIMTRLYLAKNQPERLDDHIQVMDNVSRRMKTLVDDLLDIGRFERGLIPLKYETFSLQDLITEIAQIQQAEADHKQIRLLTDLPAEPVEIHADRNRITQVITNLVTNAINYTPNEGKITLELKRDNLRKQAVITVADTGSGIAEQHLPFIFQPFYRIDQKIKGAGLGLSIAREIVELHGGSISAQSKAGQGSRFIVRLALANG
jgi:PAS domain S-box-containing protein